MADISPDGTSMNIYLAWTWAIIWWICYPIAITVYYAAIALLFVATLLYRPVAFVLQPLVYFVRFVLACFAAPFHLLAKLESLYIFLGVAAITGVLGGLLIGCIYGSLSSVLGLNSSDQQYSRQRPPSRTAKQYRETKRKQKVEAEAPLMTSGVLSPTGPLSPGYFNLSESQRDRGRGLLNQTIMEEMDSDY